MAEQDTRTALRMTAIAGALSRIGDINEPPLRDALDYIRTLGAALETARHEHAEVMAENVGLGKELSNIAGSKYLGTFAIGRIIRHKARAALKERRKPEAKRNA